MYAGALFTLAELPGGVVYLSSFDTRRFYPIVKDMQIRFRRPAKTDITVEVHLSDDEVQRIQNEADANGKADFEWECELKGRQWRGGGHLPQCLSTAQDRGCNA